MHDCSKMGQDYKLRLDHTWIQSGSGHFQVLSHQDPFIVAYLKRLSLRPKLSQAPSSAVLQPYQSAINEVCYYMVKY